MPIFHTGVVTAILEERPGLQRVDVEVDPPDEEQSGRAHVLTDLIGVVEEGDRVVINTTAVELGLGTGGWHFVHWNLERHSLRQPGPGHIMKLRYTSLQADTGAAEEHGPDTPVELHGMPVAVCGLHSQMAAAAIACRHHCPDLRLVYVMTDGAALPIVLSDLVAGLRDRGLLDATVTAGNAFGGDLEAVTVASALALARHRLDADAVLVAMGPGITGTGSTLGTTGLEVANVLDQVVALGGRPLAVLRMSSGDQRVRHHGISHHSETVLDLVRSPVTVPVAEPIDLPGRHHTALVSPPDMAPLIEATGLDVTTMGRGPREDPAFFAAAGAAGVLLGRWAEHLG